MERKDFIETKPGISNFEKREIALDKFPKMLEERHDALNKIHNLILNGEYSVEELFDFEKTIHADLELIWMRPEMLEKFVGSPEEYQVVVAKVETGQTSDAHLHEVGSSSFVVLGDKSGFIKPADLVYRTGYIDFLQKKAILDKEYKCEDGLEMDIPSNQIHQFENKTEKPAHVLIVTHPIISVKEGEVDIHFAK
ncbi:MAG: hypothetical protein WC087_03370 [Candidatus Paceibacterota bacterium]